MTGELQSTNYAVAIERQCSGGTQASSLASVTVATSVSGSAAIDVRRYSQGQFSVPVGSSLTSIDWYAADESGGTYLPLYNGGTALTTTVAAGRRYAFPSEALAGAWLKGVGNAAGEIVDVALKG